MSQLRNEPLTLEVLVDLAAMVKALSRQRSNRAMSRCVDEVVEEL